MAYVPVPKDLSKVKTKVAFNLTKRQILCFSVALLIGLPLFFLLKDSAGTSLEIKGYSRFVKYSDILEGNGGNLNIPRYIQKIDDTLPQNIAAHLKGGIPGKDVESLKRLWAISPDLKLQIFKCIDETHDVCYQGCPEIFCDDLRTLLISRRNNT